MKYPLSALVVFAFSSLATLHGQAPSSAVVPQPTKSVSPALDSNYGKLPLSFEANHGQTDSRVRFLSRGQGYSLFLTDSAAVLALTKQEPANKLSRPAATTLAAARSNGDKNPTKASKTDVVRMELTGAAQVHSVSGAEPLPGKSNYFIGNDPAKWQTDVPTFAKVKYAGVYPGVDLVYYGNQRQLEYDFIVAPGSDPKPIRLHFAGASKLKLGADGDLLVQAKDGAIAFHKPVIYQTIAGQRQPISGEFKLMAKNTIGFTLGDYDRSRELVIDPVLAYSTYLGGSGSDYSTGIAIDPAGNTYIVGYTYSTDFPTTQNAFDQTNPDIAGAPSVFISKMNAAGSALVYSTYLGGHGSTAGDQAGPIGITADGSAYVAGRTSSEDFPVTSGAFQKVYPGQKTSQGYGYTGFVTKLNPTGSALTYSTYLGSTGTYGTAGFGAVDTSGDVYVTGQPASADFPVTSGAYQKTMKPGGFFITKLNPSGSQLVYSTFFGGGGENTQQDVAQALAVNSTGQLYFAGTTYHGQFPVSSGAFQSVNRESGLGSAFVTELNAAGSGIIYSTFLGGTGAPDGVTGGDSIYALALDASGNAYVTGAAYSTNFPITPGAYQTVHPEPPYPYDPESAPFVTKLNPTGSALVYSTFLGGGFNEYGEGIAVDKSGRAYVSGSGGPGFPLTPDAIDTNVGYYLTVFNPSGSDLFFSSFAPGSQLLALDCLENVVVTGSANPAIFVTTPGAFQRTSHANPTSISKIVFNGATTTSIISLENPTTSGSSATFKATVAAAAGSDVSTGKLIFIIDGVVAPFVELDGSGEASYTASDLAAGAHRVVASYLGDPAKYSASSNELTENVTGQVETPTFAEIGGTFQNPLHVKIETTTPGAAIYYTTDSTTPGIGSTLYTTPFAVSATVTVKAIAVVSGDTSSPVATATFTVLPTAIRTTTVLQSTPNPSTSGQAVTFTATVTAASGPTPTGSVTFKHSAVVMGTAPLIGGVAQLTFSNLDPADHAVNALTPAAQQTAQVSRASSGSR